MKLDIFSDTVERLYREGAKIAYIVATFGTTDGFGIDDIAGIRSIIDKAAAQHRVSAPQLHVDAAVGWAVTFLADYDTATNSLMFDPEVLELVRTIQHHSQGLRYADSVTIDFHKMGRGHYPSSAFIVNRKDDLRYLARTVHDTPYFPDADSRRDPALFTLECSRPGLGPYIVMASLNGIGLMGWAMLVGRSLELASRLKTRLAQLDYCKVLNMGASSPSVNWWVLPKGRNAEEIYQRLVAGQLSEEQRHRYFGEIRRLYDKREKMMEPGLDARLGFTLDFGYNPHGIEIPAWKAVFFNPKTSDEVVDRIVFSIEEMI